MATSLVAALHLDLDALVCVCSPASHHLSRPKAREAKREIFLTPGFCSLSRGPRVSTHILPSLFSHLKPLPLPNSLPPPPESHSASLTVQIERLRFLLGEPTNWDKDDSSDIRTTSGGG